MTGAELPEFPNPPVEVLVLVPPKRPPPAFWVAPKPVVFVVGLFVPKASDLLLDPSPQNHRYGRHTWSCGAWGAKSSKCRGLGIVVGLAEATKPAAAAKGHNGRRRVARSGLSGCGMVSKQSRRPVALRRKGRVESKDRCGRTGSPSSANDVLVRKQRLYREKAYNTMRRAVGNRQAMQRNE